MKFIKGNQRASFILLLCALHLPFVFESFWYDEAALVENAHSLEIFALNDGLNWLQSVPPGYFLISKLFLALPLGIYLGRLFSLVLLMASAIIVDKYVVPAESKKQTRFLIIGILMINSSSLKYGTDFKPYTAELFFSLAFIAVSKNPTLRKFLVLSLLAPWFGATTFILGFASIVLTIFKSRKRIYAIPLFILLTNTFLVSTITPLNTQKEFKIAWFGNQEDSVFNSVKSAVGGLLWFPTSGLGWVSDNQFGAQTYFVSGLVMIVVFFTILMYSRSDSNFLILILGFTLITAMHALRILPAAGRLFLGLSALLVVVFFASTERFATTQKSRVIIAGLVIAICTLSLSFKIANSSVLETSLPTSTQMRIYSDIDNAPEIKYLASKESKVLEPSIIVGVSNKKVLTCSDTSFYEGDLVVTWLDDLDEVSDTFGKRVFKKLGTRNNGSLVFEVQNTYVSSTTLAIQDNLDCKYRFRNAR